jgi:hypothetical protein
MKIFLSLAFAAAAALPAYSAGAGLCRELRLRSAGVFFDSIAYELRKDPAARKALDGLPEGGPAQLLAGPAADDAATQASIFDAAAALPRTDGLAPEAAEAVAAALAEARAYIAPSAARACEPAPPPAPAAAPPDTVFHEKGAPETAATDPGLVEWKGADDYAASRLGPLTALLDRLGPGDEIWLSNLGLPELLPRLGTPASVTALNLPISGYAKRLWLLKKSGGGSALALSDFQGKIYLRHFELLLRRHYSGKKAPAIRAAESPSAYERYYGALARVCAAKNSPCAGLEGVIAGYGEAFRVHWASYAVTSASDGDKDWRLDVYRPAGAGRWGVITARSSFYGETLGENIARLVEISTGVRAAVIAGSGGSLEPRELYGFAYPSHVLTPSGAAVENELGSPGDFRAHRSALSPLEETPAWISRALADGVSTVDVEMGPAAELLSRKGLRLGFAVLVTDFPLHSPAVDKLLARASLARQDAAVKYRNIEDYIFGLGEWLLRGMPPGRQPIEKMLGRTLAEQSALNLAARERELSPFSPEERALLAKLEKFFRVTPPSFSVRMSRARAERLLEDEAFLSTELVSLLKGSEVKPFTPDYEQASYGARRYIFGTLSYWDGPEKYGDTVVRLKERTWKRRSWATRRSAMRALAIVAGAAGVTPEEAAGDPEMTGQAEEMFNSWIIVPADLPRALALQVTEELRALPPGAFSEFARAAPAAIPGLIKKHDVGWLEGRVFESAGLADIELIKVPAGDTAVTGKAARLGIKTVRIR